MTAVKPIRQRTERPNTVSGLEAKRAELRKLRERLESDLKAVTCDLDHLDAAIRLFDPETTPDAIRRYTTRHRARKGSVRRFVLAALRDATEPITSRQITEAWCAERGLKADAATNEVGILGNQLVEMQDQTNAISDQTNAIKASSAATVRSAGAQIASAESERQSAEIAAAAAKPGVTMKDALISGFEATPSNEGMVPVTLKPEFLNTGGSSFSVDTSTVSLSTGGGLPNVPDESNASKFGGSNDFVATINMVFGPPDPITFNVPANVAGAVNAGLRNVYIFGILNYTDSTGQSHRFCYAYEVEIKDGSGSYIKSTGGPAYHCNT